MNDGMSSIHNKDTRNEKIEKNSMNIHSGKCVRFCLDDKIYDDLFVDVSSALWVSSLFFINESSSSLLFHGNRNGSKRSSLSHHNFIFFHSSFFVYFLLLSLVFHCNFFLYSFPPFSMKRTFLALFLIDQNAVNILYRSRSHNNNSVSVMVFHAMDCSLAVSVFNRSYLAHYWSGR